MYSVLHMIRYIIFSYFYIQTSVRLTPEYSTLKLLGAVLNTF